MATQTQIQKASFEEYIDDVSNNRIVTGELVKHAVRRHLTDLKTAHERGFYFDRHSAIRACELFPTFFRHSKGGFAGHPLKLMPWQSFIIAMLFGWKRIQPSPLSGRTLRRFRRAYIEVARKNGKALGLNTPIPTVDGWKTQGTLVSGDIVFDENGKQCNVVAVGPIQYDRPCYKLTFSDGTTIIADEQHEWYTEAAYSGRGQRQPHKKNRTFRDQHIRTTQEILDTLRAGGEYQQSNHRIPLAGAFDTPTITLPLDPYVLGAWLGDGVSEGTNITIGKQDAAEMSAILASKGYPIRKLGPMRYTFSTGKHGPRKGRPYHAWRSLNVFNNKHIPPQYMRASIEQRLELLRGLMDTDGYASKGGQCEFCNTNERLARDVFELVRGLGYKPTFFATRAKLYGKDCGPKYSVMFYAERSHSCFRLERKTQRLRETLKVSKYRYIVNIEPVASEPVRCIQVDSPNHLYLCSEAFIPTHNSTLMAGLALMLLLFDREPGARVYLAATGLAQTTEVWEPIVETLYASPALIGAVRVYDSQNNHKLVVPTTKSTLTPVHGDARRLDGLNVSGAIIDELHRHPTPKLWEVLDSATGAREQPLIAIITTAGENQNSVCYERHNYIRNVLSGSIDDDAWFGFIAAIDDNDRWDDEKVWEKANPNLRYIPTLLDELRSKVKSARNSTAERINFFIKHTCRWATSATAWLKVEDWDKCRSSFTYDDMKHRPDGSKRPVFAAFDLAETMDLTAVCLCFPPIDDETKTRYMWKLFLPEETFEKYASESKYPWQQWRERGELQVTPGAVADPQNVRKTLLQWAEDFDLQFCGHDKYRARQLVSQLIDDGIPMAEIPQGYKLCEAAKRFETQVRTATMEHNGEGIMRWQADNAAVKSDGQGNFYPIRPQKNLNDRKIDGIIAAVIACEVAIRTPVSSGPIYACLN